MAARARSNPCAWSSSASGSKVVPRRMIGANREESRRRPMTSPVCRRAEPGSLRCLLAGADFGPDGTFPQMGTWLGVNEAGLAVAVTNRSDGELAWEDQTRSKGLLAVNLLDCHRPEDALRFARAELASGGFGGCNVLVAGRDRGRRPGARRGADHPGRADAGRPRHDQPGRQRSRRPEDPPGHASDSTRASSRPPRPASAATSGSSSPAPSGARSRPAWSRSGRRSTSTTSAATRAAAITSDTDGPMRGDREDETRDREGLAAQIHRAARWMDSASTSS